MTRYGSSVVWHTPDGTPAAYASNRDTKNSAFLTHTRKDNMWSHGYRVSPDLTTAAHTPHPTSPPEEGWTHTHISTPPTCSSIWICVEGAGFCYKLTEDDVKCVFSRYGTVNSVKVSPDGLSAIITFAAPVSASNAMQELHGKSLTGMSGSLSVTYAPQAMAAGAHSMGAGYRGLMSPTPFPQLPPLLEQGTCTAPHAAFHAPASVTAASSPTITHAHLSATDSLPHSPPDNIMPDGRPIRKYTARFDIGIENDREFQVARRIIGSRGANMKSIVKVSDAKLRLRGKGSGFLEGVARQESPEPLHLCVSCRTFSGYASAVRMTADLLLRVYSEYYSFCASRGIDTPEMAIQLREVPLVSRAGTTTGAWGEESASTYTQSRSVTAQQNKWDYTPALSSLAATATPASSRTPWMMSLAATATPASSRTPWMMSDNGYTPSPMIVQKNRMTVAHLPPPPGYSPLGPCVITPAPTTGYVN